MAEKNNSLWFAFDGLNVNYLLDQYDIYLEDPSAVDESFLPIFRVWQGLDGLEVDDPRPTTDGTVLSEVVVSAEKVAATVTYAANIRKNGHLQADIYPLTKQEEQELLKQETYNLTDEDLKDLPASIITKYNQDLNNAFEAVQYLKGVYAGDFGTSFEFDHTNPEEIAWFEEKLESGYIEETASLIDEVDLLDQLYKAEKLEQYLGKVYVGQKRFGLEGVEALIPVLNKLVDLAGENGMKDIVMAMAHRGRLNALVHVLDQPYEWLLSMFEGVKYERENPTNYDLFNSSNDVKYHLGAETTRHYGDNDVSITLANNPSHLEAVNSVAVGMTRAKQDDRSEAGYPKQDVDKAMPILVHGDAAHIGQGVVAEQYNYSGVEAYTTGGVMHVIANNIIGFTAELDELQTSKYSSDLGKGYGVPVIHMNADKPESAIVGTMLAYEYRQTFHKDIILDVMGYRRLGHNEMDEPRQTNPMMYHLIDNHDTITEVYQQDLLDRGAITQDQIDKIAKETLDRLDNARANLGTEPLDTSDLFTQIEEKIVDFPEVETKVERDELATINKDLLNFRDEIHVFDKLKRQLLRRDEVFDKDLPVEWGLAEALAFGTILEEGTPIRITGEESERGTFSHRNLVLACMDSGTCYSPLHDIPQAKASFDIHNSTLSEYSISSFEYGYDLGSRESLVIWEAQYGDFANGAQILFDQFVSSGSKKFGDLSGFVLFLPHGYEGAGPEHSSARVERFLQLSAENSWTVANVTNAAQIFHILRRQAKLLKDDTIRPLVLFTPKALLRGEDSASSISDLTDGSFKEILETPATKAEDKKVKRLIIGSGRFTVDLRKHMAEDKDETVALTSIEQLYPLDIEAIKANIARYENLEEIVWAQEEPENQGPWNYMAMNLYPVIPDGVELKYVGRPAMSATAEGNAKLHKATQAQIINMVFE